MKLILSSIAKIIAISTLTLQGCNVEEFETESDLTVIHEQCRISDYWNADDGGTFVNGMSFKSKTKENGLFQYSIFSADGRCLTSFLAGARPKLVIGFEDYDLEESSAQTPNSTFHPTLSYLKRNEHSSEAIAALRTKEVASAIVSSCSSGYIEVQEYEHPTGTRYSYFVTDEHYSPSFWDDDKRLSPARSEYRNCKIYERMQSLNLSYIPVNGVRTVVEISFFKNAVKYVGYSDDN